MDFNFSPEQDQLRESVRAFLSEEVAPLRQRMAVEGDGAGVDHEVWSKMAELGWPSLLVPEAAGGLGLGLVDAVVVLEEMGRVCAPGPFLSSAVGASIAARDLGCDELSERLGSGDERGTIALEEFGHGDPVDRIRTRAVRKGDTWRLDGLKPIVLDGEDADWIIVAARTPEGTGSFLLEDARCSSVRTLDPTRRIGRLELEATTARRIGPDDDHTAFWRAIADTTAIALAAELIGVSEAALEMAINYAETRVQFDVPLSSHQVIQHKLVDMLHVLELGRVGVHHAAWAADADDESRARSAAIAKASMAEAAIAVTADNIQVHGAVGFSWDSDAHFFYKRAKANDLLFGAQGWQRSRIADAVLATS